MKAFIFKITARRETEEDVALDLHPQPLDGYQHGVLKGTGEWNRALVLHALKNNAPELYEQLRALPLDTEFVFAPRKDFP